MCVRGLEEEFPNLPEAWRLFDGWARGQVFGYGACSELCAHGSDFDFGVGLSVRFEFSELEL